MDFVEFLVLLSIIAVVLSIWWYVSMPKNLPPGALGLPFIGCVLNSVKQEPHLLLERWTKKYGPVISFYMGRQLVVVLGSYETIEEALIKQGDVFSGRGHTPVIVLGGLDIKSGVLASDGPEWKEQRRFALSTLRDFGFGRPILQGKISEEVEYLLKDISSKSGQPFDIQMMFNRAVSNVICSMVFGHRFDDEEFWRSLDRMNFRVSQSRITFLTPLLFFPWVRHLPIIKQQFAKFFKMGLDHMAYLTKIITETASSFNASDLPSNYVHAFLKAKHDNIGSSFTDQQLLFSVGQLFIAGSETTSTTLRFGVFFMAKHPDIQAKVYKEISDIAGTDQLPHWEDRVRLPYTEACIMEIQRHANLLPLSLVHRTMADTKLMGYDVPADAWVIPLLWNVLKDPNFFPNPEKFDPDRFLDENNKVKKEKAFIPFSAGKRICLGESLAKMELFMFFTSLITRYNFSFPEDQPQPSIKRVMGITMTPASFEICAKKRQDF